MWILMKPYFIELQFREWFSRRKAGFLPTNNCKALRTFWLSPAFMKFVRILSISCKLSLHLNLLSTFFDPSAPIHFVSDVERNASGLHWNGRIAVHCGSWENVKVKGMGRDNFGIFSRSKESDSNLHDTVLFGNSRHLQFEEKVLFDIFKQACIRVDLCHYPKIWVRQIRGQNW